MREICVSCRCYAPKHLPLETIRLVDGTVSRSVPSHQDGFLTKQSRQGSKSQPGPHGEQGEQGAAAGSAPPSGWCGLSLVGEASSGGHGHGPAYRLSRMHLTGPRGGATRQSRRVPRTATFASPRGAWRARHCWEKSHPWGLPGRLLLCIRRKRNGPGQRGTRQLETGTRPPALTKPHLRHAVSQSWLAVLKVFHFFSPKYINL